LPIFSQSSSTKGNSKISIPTTSNSDYNNAIPFVFAFPPQMFPYTQNSNTNNIMSSPSRQPVLSNNVISSPSRRSVPSLDEFFTKLDESSGGTGEFTSFKNIFEDERITVDQIYDLTDAEMNQLGINKIGWRKVIRAAAQRYK